MIKATVHFKVFDMKLKSIIHVLCVIILFVSCGVNDDKEIDVVTGLHLFDANGSALGLWNEPNDNLGDALCYPNPSNGILSLASQDQIIKVWILEGNCMASSDETIREDASTLNYTIGKIEEQQIREIPIIDFNGIITLNLTDLGEGFYRIFYMTVPEDLFWQNVYVDPNITSFQDLLFINDACN